MKIKWQTQPHLLTDNLNIQEQQRFSLIRPPYQIEAMMRIFKLPLQNQNNNNTTHRKAETNNKEQQKSTKENNIANCLLIQTLPSTSRHLALNVPTKSGARKRVEKKMKFQM